MYEVDSRFGRSDMTIEEKSELLAKIHDVPKEVIRKEYSSAADMQMPELRIWQYINSCIYKRKGRI